METERVLCMNGGEGDTSYANNSTLQEKVILKVKSLLEESVKRLLHHANHKNNLKVVDLGCSSGPNSLMVVYHIVKTIIDNTKMSLYDYEMPFIQIYLNDLFENDFNSIFKLVPNFYQRIQEIGENFDACFINATPGSFYGRLFPNNDIHLFHSSYSLHWLSQAPTELNKEGEPLNKGNIHITSTSPPIVYKAYFEQFQSDFKLFLKSRFDELISGGSMVLTFIGREKAPEISTPEVIIGMVLKDMALEGLIEETKLDSFNVPTYHPTVEEVRQIIVEEGSFTLQALKTMKMGWDANLHEDNHGCVLDTKMRGEFVAKSMRPVIEPILSVEFGKHTMNELFSRFGKKVSNLMESELLEYTNMVMHLTKASWTLGFAPSM